ncbi:hypothetical protein BE221DRAFT_75014 [Ostreococcus tauri]|uniref:Uncharacterized protein n=1 Tax=Ostreococcus tauri TaxID=70448 RepID=A0A1Y5I9Y7_OSTTA|nr:hypothetical protein BE221DRAFT_75014 [Ostreococcus tauri]
MSVHSGGFEKLPRFGLSFPAKIFNAVDLPIPFVPTKPKTCPARGVGNLCSLNVFGPYRCVVSFSRFFGRLIIVSASNGHFFTQIPHPMHSSSERNAILSFGETSMQSLPTFTTGHDRLHSCLHFLGRHFSALTMAILSSLSFASAASFFFPIARVSGDAASGRRRPRAGASAERAGDR